MKESADNIPLGRETVYIKSYSPNLLCAIARKDKRHELGIMADNLPFHGVDLWNAYEVSWLDKFGKPEVRLAQFYFDATSPNIIESKSLKLYLNSFNGHRFDSEDIVLQYIKSDLTSACGLTTKVKLLSINAPQQLLGAPKNSIALDNLNTEIDTYNLNPKLLKTINNAPQITQKLHSHLLKSNCLITNQPDWATIVIEYTGQPICHKSLLSYIISFREHNEFHEQCVERMYQDIMLNCRPEKLLLYARYVRRGGLDINPYRANFVVDFDFTRLSRQ